MDNLIGKKQKKKWWYRILSVFVAVNFIGSFVLAPQTSYAQGLPAIGSILTTGESFAPLTVRGITIHPKNPLEFDFIIDSGDMKLEGEDFRKESMKLIKYFLASLTTPEKDMWVNLSPYEQDRITPETFGETIMGQDLLIQDYLLKQITASLMYPESQSGDAFWKRVYDLAYEKFGTTDVPMNAFNKVWIVPSKVEIYQQGLSAYIVESKLKVMLEKDYLAESQFNAKHPQAAAALKQDLSEEQDSIAQEIIREIIIPELEKEVNEGKHFASLRQIYNSMIIAKWYKENLPQTLLGRVYMDSNRTKSVEAPDQTLKDKVYHQYVDIFKKGAYEQIKETYDPETKQLVPRKYFSGGIGLDETQLTKNPDAAQLVQALDQAELTNVSFALAPEDRADSAMVRRDLFRYLIALGVTCVSGCAKFSNEAEPPSDIPNPDSPLYKIIDQPSALGAMNGLVNPTTNLIPTIENAPSGSPFAGVTHLGVHARAILAFFATGQNATAMKMTMALLPLQNVNGIDPNQGGFVNAVQTANPNEKTDDGYAVGVNAHVGRALVRAYYKGTEAEKARLIEAIKLLVGWFGRHRERNLYYKANDDRLFLGGQGIAVPAAENAVAMAFMFEQKGLVKNIEESLQIRNDIAGWLQTLVVSDQGRKYYSTGLDENRRPIIAANLAIEPNLLIPIMARAAGLNANDFKAGLDWLISDEMTVNFLVDVPGGKQRVDGVPFWSAARPSISAEFTAGLALALKLTGKPDLANVYLQTLAALQQHNFIINPGRKGALPAIISPSFKEYPGHFPYSSIVATAAAIIATSGEAGDFALTAAEQKQEADQAMAPGGIDLDSSEAEINVKGNLEDVQWPVIEFNKPLDQIQFDGFYPVFINSTPVSIQMLLGLDTQETEEETNQLSRADLDPADWRRKMI